MLQNFSVKLINQNRPSLVSLDIQKTDERLRAIIYRQLKFTHSPKFMNMILQTIAAAHFDDD